MALKITGLTCSAWNDDGTLFASAELEGYSEDVRICFYIYRSGEKGAILKSPYAKSSYLVYKVDRLGEYKVKCFARKNLTGEKVSCIECFEFTESNAKALAQEHSIGLVVPAEFEWTSAEHRIVGDEVEFCFRFDFGGKAYTLRYEYYYRGELAGEFGTTKRNRITFPLYGAGDYKVVCVFRDSATCKEYRKELEFYSNGCYAIVQTHEMASKTSYSSSFGGPSEDKMNVVFTIDAEHNCGGNPIRLSGDLSSWGIKENFGCRGIMEVFEEFDARAVFFLNVYEAESFDAEHSGYMHELIREIAERGHEVAVHCHLVPKNNNAGILFPFNRANLSDLGLEEQIERLSAASEFIKGIIGKSPISFRAGAYRINSDTFEALKATGFKYDSSCYFANPANRIPFWQSVAKPTILNGLVEFPVVPIIEDLNTVLAKFDFDVLSNEEIVQALKYMKMKCGMEATQIMFHSFSLLRNFPQHGEVHPLVSFGRGKECFGGNADAKNRLRELLRDIKGNGSFDIKTFEVLNKEGFHPKKDAHDGPVLTKETEWSVGRLVQWQRYNVCTDSRVYRIFNAGDLFASLLIEAKCTVSGGVVSIALSMKPWACNWYQFSFQLAMNGAINILESTPYSTSPMHVFSGLTPGIYKIFYVYRDCCGNSGINVVRSIEVKEMKEGRVSFSNLMPYRENAGLWYFALASPQVILSGKYMGFDIVLPFDWSCKGISSRSFCYRMHSLTILDGTIKEYECTKSAEYGKILHDYILDWIRVNPRPRSGNEWAWHDEATAKRVVRLVYCLCLFEELWNDAEIGEIKTSLEEQAELLADDSFYTFQHNHGMHQDFGLIFYALFVCADDTLRKRYLDLAIGRALNYFEFVYCKDGVHKEHSPAYAMEVSQKAYDFSVLVGLYDIEAAGKFRDYHEKGERFLVDCTMPNGKLPSLGDTTEVRSKYEPERDVVFKDGGYAIFRSSWYDSPLNATWIMFVAATHSSAHKHSDDLSFLLYHKGELFVEAGNRNYNYADPRTAYAYSGYAHNVLCVDDMDFPVTIGSTGFRSVPKVAMNTRITTFSIGDDVKTVTGVQERFPDIVQTRTLTYDKKGKVVTVLDELDASRKFKASLLFHVAEGVAVTSEGGMLRFSRKGNPVATMSIESALPVNVRVLHGEGEAPYHAWIFNGKTEPKSGSLVVVDAMCGAGKSTVTACIRLQ